MKPEQEREEAASIMAGCFSPQHPAATHQRRGESGMMGTLQTHSSQLQTEALKPSERDNPRDKGNANLGKALDKSTQTRSNQYL